MNGFVAACLDWEAAEKAKVDVATWGHLAPEPQHKYRGTLVFACGLYQSAAMILREDFPGLEDSPWQHRDFHAWLDTWETMQKRDPAGKVFCFEGFYQRVKTKGFRMVGNIKEVPLRF
jgi:hypothetical protein